MKDSQNKLYYLLSKTNKTTKHTLPVLFRYANSDTKKTHKPDFELSMESRIATAKQKEY